MGEISDQDADLIVQKGEEGGRVGKESPRLQHASEEVLARLMGPQAKMAHLREDPHTAGGTLL